MSESPYIDMVEQGITISAMAEFASDDDGRPAKRLKRVASRGNSGEFFQSRARRKPGKDPETQENPGDVEILNSDYDSDERSFDDDVDRRVLPTALESALPPVRTDKQAILEYEASKAAGDDDSTEQPGAKYRSSIYVDAFNLSLDIVLEHEAYLFDASELAVFQQWRELDYEAQYLYVRLFLRKTSSWHRISRLGYTSDISDLPRAAKVLQERRSLETVEDIHKAQSVPKEHCSLGFHFTFADSSETSITTLEEASSILSLDELKAIAKDAKIQGKNKTELLKSFRQMSQRQTGLGWVGLKRFDSESHNSGNDDSSDSGVHGFEDDNRDRHFLRKIMADIGPCIRLSPNVLRLFERVHLVFYRSTEWTEKSLTTIILARISRRTFPQYIISRSSNIFPSRDILIEFEAAIKLQFRVDNILEFNGPPSKVGLDEILSIFGQIYPHWQVLLQQEQKKEDSVYDQGEGAYLRRFSPAWVYTRIIHKAAWVLGRLKRHAREHEVLWSLLDQDLFHSARRGAWYQRAALIEEHYMAALQPAQSSQTLEQQKRHWKGISLQTCERGLQDRNVHVIYHYDLQKRIRKLERSMRIVKREQHDFGHVSLAKPVEREVHGIRMQRSYSGTRSAEQPQRSTKTIWLDSLGDGGECSVETMCLSWYRAQNRDPAADGSSTPTWKGYHSEGGILRTLFAYLFHDILFAYVPNVFQTPFQTCPLDLHTDGFYPARASAINHRLAALANGAAADLIRDVDTRERESRTCVVGLDWDFALADLLEMVDCWDGAALATVCKVMAQEYPQRGGGVPDLFLWNAKMKTVLFVEVKSENDRLSDTQRLWIHVLTGAGVRVELCNAVAREVRVVKCL